MDAVIEAEEHEEIVVHQYADAEANVMQQDANEVP